MESKQLKKIQNNNKQWWTDNQMSYDWKRPVAFEKFSSDWFKAIDNEFIYAARNLGEGKPFSSIIPFDNLAGKKVLEIGCGMGLHSELMLKSGADLTSIDISQTSVDATKARLALKKLNSKNVFLMDSSNLPFEDNSFSFVWSWGVIHHSAWTGRSLKEIHRVLKPGGEVRFMVYNLSGMSAYIALLRYFLLFWKGRKIDSCLNDMTDGAVARYYTEDTLSDLISIFFEDFKVETLGQDVDVLPLPRKLRELFIEKIGTEKYESRVRNRGGFLFATAKKS